MPSVRYFLAGGELFGLRNLTHDVLCRLEDHNGAVMKSELREQGLSSCLGKLCARAKFR